MRLSALAVLAAFLVAVPATAQSPDPVGDYVWSFSMADGGVVHGTMNVARTDSGYTATFTSDHTEGSLGTHAVKVDGAHVVVDLTGDFGEFTLDMQLADSISATYKLVTNEGEPSSGPMTVQRVKKSAAAAGLRRARVAVRAG